MADHEILRTKTEAPVLSPWPLLTGIAASVPLFVGSIDALPHGWRLGAFPLAIGGGFAVGGITDWLQRRRAGVAVELSAQTVRIGTRSMSTTEGLAALRRLRLEDRHAFETLRVMVARQTAHREVLPIRDVRAMLGFIGEDGLRIELETAAWALVANAQGSGTAGPALQFRVASSRVVHGVVVGSPEAKGGDAPAVRGVRSTHARSYRVPTRFVRPAQGRAYLEPQFDLLSRDATA